MFFLLKWIRNINKLSISISVACISKGCFAFSVFTRVPIIFIDELIDNLLISLKFDKLSVKTIWIFLKNEPSFSSINPNVLESLTVLTHPSKVIFWSIYFSVFLYKSFYC